MVKAYAVAINSFEIGGVFMQKYHEMVSESCLSKNPRKTSQI
jgi:hypothetical protein